MLLLDDLLMLPIAGFRSVMNTLLKVAMEEYTDEAPIKEELLELQMRLDAGEITEAEYVKGESHILNLLREIKARKRELAGLPPEETQGLSGKVMQGSGASLTVEFNPPESTPGKK